MFWKGKAVEGIDMATIDHRNKRFRVIYYYQGVRFQHPLRAKKKREAEQLLAMLERNLDLLQQGALQLPGGGGSVRFPSFRRQGQRFAEGREAG